MEHIKNSPFNRKLLKACLVGIALALIWWFRVPLADFMAFVKDRQAISAYIQGFGVLGPLMLFVILVAQVFVAIIPGHALMMTAGYVYGIKLGLLIVAASTIFSSQMAFLVARRYGRTLIYRLAAPEIIERWDRVAGRQGVLFYIFAFTLPIFPSDLMCYVAGLGKISSRGFFVANFIGRLFCAIFITLIGVYGFQPPAQFWMFVALSMAVLFAGWAIYKKRCVNIGNALCTDECMS